MAALCVVFAACVGTSGAASSSTVVAASVPSATTIDAAGCLPGVMNKTDFGLVTPGSSSVTSLDCVIVFGSSNDTSMLRMSQTDGGGDAMVPSPVGAALAMWTMNGNFEDMSGTANDGDPFPAPPADPSYVAGGPGRGQAMSFDGDDTAWIPHHASYDVLSFTVDAWIRTVQGGTAVIAARETQACGNGAMCQWEFWMDAGRFHPEIEVGSTWHGALAPAPINDGQWHHVAMTVDDATKELRSYVDGQLAAVDSTWNAGSADTGTVPIVLGMNGDGLDPYVGEVDELRFQPGVRTISDVRRIAGGRVQDYANGSQDWDTPIATTSMFGTCLTAVATGGVTDGSTFVPLAGCAATDGPGWRALPATSADPASKVAIAPSGDVDATALLRFGFRPGSAQPPGAYEAPVAFEVIAPAA